MLYAVAVGQIKTSWNGYVSVSSSAGKVSWKRTELNLWINMNIIIAFKFFLE